MTPERWRQVRSVFDAAVELEGDERTRFLTESCDRVPSLLEAVKHLLTSHEAAEDFIEEPLVRIAPTNPDTEPYQRELRHIGPYALERVLGRGGMGTVYLATRADRAYQRKVAVKVLRRELDSEELARRFRNERQILASLDHPSIARLLDGGTVAGGRPYLVMEFVEGEPLDRYCDSHRFSIARRLRLFRQVCGAVHSAHRSLIVHRDLKPGNILVTEAGDVKLLDFGIAKLLEPEEFPQTVVATAPGEVPMTLEYASPEQARGEPVTTASDVYSLGVVLYELLTGHRPHQSPRSSRDELLRAICDEPPERPSTVVARAARSIAAERAAEPRRLRRTLRGDLDNIVLKALRKDPRRRYASAAELSRDIECYLTHRPILARPDRFLYRAGKLVRRYPWGVGAAAVGLLALGVFVIALLVQRDRILKEKTRAEEVTELLIDLFEVSDPDRSRGEERTAREVMDQGAREIPIRLRGQPELQSELLEAIGRVYQKLGLYDRAVALQEKSLALRLDSLAPEHPSVASSLRLVADLLLLANEYDQADSRYREALVILERSDDPELERVLVGLSKVTQHQGQFEESERLHRQALAAARRIFGQQHPRTAEDLTNLGNLFWERGDYAAAEEALNEALTIHRQLGGGEGIDETSEIAGLYNDLGLVLHSAGEYDRGEVWFGKALEVQQRLFDENHPDLANTRYNLASLLHDRSRFSEAETLCRKALAARRLAFGDRHRKVAEALNLLGLIRRDLEDPDAAEKFYREALEIWSDVLGKDHPEVATGLANLASVLRSRGELEEAEDLYGEALRVSRAVFGNEHIRTATILNNLARLVRDRGDLEAARRLLRESLALRRRLLGEDHPDVASTLHGLAGVLRRLGDYEAAEEKQREALEIYTDKLGEANPRAGLAMQSLAAILILQDRAVEAEELARQALGVFAEALPEDHLWTLAARSVLGGSLAGQERFAEAEALLIETHDRLRAKQGEQGALVVETRGRLVHLYETWGRPAKVMEWMPRKPRDE